MNNIHVVIPVILGTLLFASCISRPGNVVLTPPPITVTPEPDVVRRPYTILDYKNKTSGETIPAWVTGWLNSGEKEVEALNAYQNSYVFIHRNEGNNFNALSLWEKNFSPEHDFPRLAATRIEARFSASVPFPDEEYGALYESLIRAASDAYWTGAVEEDNFWILKKYDPYEDEPERESWEFLILVSIEKTRFKSQLNSVFEKTNPNPAPAAKQIEAFNRVKNQFFEGF